MLNPTMPHSWEWKPSTFSNSVVSALLHVPILHRVISRQILLLRFTGWKSGKHYSVPVGYVREGQTVTILTKRIRGWWHNFQEPAPVEALIERRNYRGLAKVLTDEASIIPVFVDLVKKYPYYAGFYGLPNQPSIEDVQSIAPKLIVLRITLSD